MCMETGQRRAQSETPVCSLPEGCENPIPELDRLDMLAVQLFHECQDQFSCLVGMGGAIRDRFIHSELGEIAGRYGIEISPPLHRRLKELIRVRLADQEGIQSEPASDDEDAAERRVN